MSSQTKQKCPLCLEVMDLTDKHLKPCKCGYEICLWCWHRIMEMDQKDESGGKCPGCRSVYNKDRIMGTSISNKILKELCADTSNLQKEQIKSHKQKPAKVQLGLAEEPKDPNNVRVIQRKLVYIVGMPSEFGSEKVLRQKNFLGQYGKIENIIIDNIGANQQIPDSGRVYVTFSREEEAVRCIQAVNGYILHGRPLKATFGVTRYCHVWLNNKDCRKPNCSYVHHKAPAEDICSKDDVSVVCARLQQLMGIDTKGLQQRSGSTLPPPIDYNSRTTICSEVSKNICTNDDRLLANGANKNPDLLPAATPRDSSLSSDSPSSIASSNNDKSQASAQLGNGASNSKPMTSAENGTSDTSRQKPQYVSVVSQGQGGSGRRLTVLTRQMASTDTRSKATGQVGNGSSNSTKLTLVRNEHSDCINTTRNPNMNLVSQRPEQPLHLLASASVKSHAGAEKKNECSDISETLSGSSATHSSTTVQSTVGRPMLSNLFTSDAKYQASTGVKSDAGAENKNEISDTSRKLAPGNHKQLSGSSASHSSNAVRSTSGRPVLSNIFTSDAKSQSSAGLRNLSDLNRKLASQNQLHPVNRQNKPDSNTGVAGASLCCSIFNNQVTSTDGKHRNSARGPQCMYNREITWSGDLVSSQCTDSIMSSRSFGVVSSTDKAAPDREGRKRQVCPPGFEMVLHSSESAKFVSSSTSDALVQDSCGITDQPHIISLVTNCLMEDNGGVTQNKNASISSSLSSTNTIQRRAQFPSTFSGSSNHPQLSPRPSGLLQCTFPCVEYFDGTSGSYMSAGGYNAFCQSTVSGMNAGMQGTRVQQPPPSPHQGWATGNAYAGMNCPQVNISYPTYTLF